MNQNDIRQSAERTIEKAEKLISLTKHEGWAVLVEIIDGLLFQETMNLNGQAVDHTYYRKIGFNQATAFVRAIPEIVKDKTIREYLLSQGRSKGFATAKGIPFLFNKQRQIAMQQLQQILGGENLERLKNATIQDAYKNS